MISRAQPSRLFQILSESVINSIEKRKKSGENIVTRQPRMDRVEI